MAGECASFDTALEWYAEELAGKRQLPAAKTREVVMWIRDFGRAIPGRTRPEDVTVRDVVMYFAEHCEEFQDGSEWYYRYKAIEGFYDELSRQFSLAPNQIRGLYDESDLDPALVESMPRRQRVEPVNWSRKDFYTY